MSTPFVDPNDRFSYENWMNDMATKDGPSRGWQARWQPRCECCGAFVRADAPGVSWAQQYGYDMDGVPDLHDPTYRCSPCTDKNGLRGTNCNETTCKYHGRNPQEA